MQADVKTLRAPRGLIVRNALHEESSLVVVVGLGGIDKTVSPRKDPVETRFVCVVV